MNRHGDTQLTSIGSARQLRVGLMLAVFASLSPCLLVSLSSPLPAAPSETARVVCVIGEQSEDELTASLVNLAAARPEAIALIDTPNAVKANQAFLAAFKPTVVVPVGSFKDGVADLEKRLGVKTAAEVTWHALFPRAERVVVCPARPRRLFLQAATLAGAMRAPLYVLQGTDREPADLQKRLADWKTTEVLAVGKAADLFPALSSVPVVTLADEAAVSAACIKQLLKSGPIANVVLSNPADAVQGLGTMSVLSPWIAVQKRAALLLTNEKGDNASDLLRAAVRSKELTEAECVLIVAGLKAVLMEKRIESGAGQGRGHRNGAGDAEGRRPVLVRHRPAVPR